MGLFDGAREQAAAKQQLTQLNARRRSRVIARQEFDTAVTRLRDIYTRERAATGQINAKQRIKFLQVSQPPLAVEDFVPHDHSWVRGDAVRILADVQRRYESFVSQYKQREQERLAELEFAKTNLKQQQALEREAIARRAEARS